MPPPIIVAPASVFRKPSFAIIHHKQWASKEMTPQTGLRDLVGSNPPKEYGVNFFGKCLKVTDVYLYEKVQHCGLSIRYISFYSNLSKWRPVKRTMSTRPKRYWSRKCVSFTTLHPICTSHFPLPPSVTDVKSDFVLTSLFAMGVLSSPGRCCSKARTTQLAVMVARIMYSKGVKATKLRKGAFITIQGQN